MKAESVNITKLKTPVTFSKEKGVSKQSVYKLIAKNKIDVIKIDGVMFVVLNDKAINYKK